MRKLRTFRETVIERLHDKEYARVYVEVALEEYSKDHDAKAFFLALKDVAEAQGGLTKLAEETHLNRSNLYSIMSGQSKPRLETVDTILQGLGFQLAISPLQTENTST